jgi:hypothetical protein
MQESELDNAGLESQEWVDVPQDQVTEVEVAVPVVDGEGITADHAITAVQPPKVISVIFCF